jgi:hypothetical protein
MKPICVRCQRFYRVKKNGFVFCEMMPKGGFERALPGTQEPDRWTPYKVWAGDLWRCEGCDHYLVVGVARAPLSEHYMPDFNDELARALLLVNDCLGGDTICRMLPILVFPSPGNYLGMARKTSPDGNGFMISSAKS